MGDIFFIVFLFVLLAYCFNKLLKIRLIRQVVIIYKGKKYVFKTYYSKFKLTTDDGTFLRMFNTYELRMFFDLLIDEVSIGEAEIKVFGVADFDAAYVYLKDKIYF